MTTTWVDYDQHARTRDRNDVWGQVRRTVRGIPVAADQIDLIVETIVDHLDLSREDVLLDLACGNGALSALLQANCRESLGVDISPYLIDVANERFADARHRFIVGDAASYTERESSPEPFTKALCYGSLSYIADPDVARTLRSLHGRFPNIDRVLLGNLPDPARATAFSTAAMDMTQPQSDIGVWRSPAHIAHLAGPGWQVESSTMPERFFAAHYRFDLLLTRSA